ncbi:phosphomannomutase/phosphoglucomutase [Cellvibrio sp. OA-2007]|uniref:phosphomannomutase/phosphoglucomutase n=1 Tax=Cellvibrio sp. OA-2007 TaxID=529823 RepID=UPI000781FE8E|nr:phosphomannomutase/phosphoglucomutase [Cellvibrio sp. OA-2007]
MNPQDLLKAKAEASTTPLSRSAQRALDAAKHKAAVQQKILLILLGIALVINAIVGYLLYQKLVVQQQQVNLHNLTQEKVDERSSALASYFKQQTQLIDKLATESELIASLDTNNPDNTAEMRAQLEKKWLRTTQSALNLRLLPLGSAQLDRNAEFPIRYAELDLIKRAEERQSTLPELVEINDRWMLNWVRPLASDEKKPPLGTVMVTIDAAELINIFNSAEQSLGEFILLQQFTGSPPQTVKKLGAGTAGNSMQSNVSGSHLVVKFTPSEQLLLIAEELPALWLSIISLIVAGSLALVWFLSKILVRIELGEKDNATPSVADVVKTSKESVSAEDAMTNPLFQKQDILDIAMIDEDENILGLQQASGKKSSATARNKINEADVPAEIFRSYDIRGLVGSQVTPELAQLIGQAVGSEAIDQGEQAIVVARDGRTHSESLTQALIRGILRSGCNVINIGVVPTPLMYFSTFHFEDTSSGVMVTASHNPKEYNGFKVVMNNRALADDAVIDLRSRIVGQRFHQGLGEETPRSIIPDYIDRIFSDVALAGNVSIVVDAGNAVTGIVAPQLFEELGCDVIPLFCDLDGEFPNHDPDPTVEKNLHALIAKVQESNADIGVAFDGDGDRLVVVTPKGDIIWPDRLLMLFAKDVLSRNPGADVLFDVKCSRQLNQVISSYGGRPIMWKTGHSPMKAKMEETQALIGGEYSGHIFIKDRWYGFDDGIYAMARLLEIITLRDQKIDDIFAAFPQLYSTPEIKIAIPDLDKFGLINKLSETGDFANGTITAIDGLRVDYTKGWGLVRASNTSPALTLRFEAESHESLEKIQQIFKRELLKVDNRLTFNLNSQD